MLNLQCQYVSLVWEIYEARGFTIEEDSAMCVLRFNINSFLQYFLFYFILFLHLLCLCTIKLHLILRIVPSYTILTRTKVSTYPLKYCNI